MSFTDERFFLFFPLSIISYYISPIEYRPLCLLIMSMVFYLSWGVAGLAFVIIVSMVTFLCAIIISRTIERKSKHFVLLLSISILLTLLIYTKIGKIMLQTFHREDISILVPLGMSYLTLSLIGYLIDVYRGQQNPEKNPLRFLLFSLYFPKAAQGPISRYKDLSGELFSSHTFDYQRVCFGFQLMIYGLFKKIVIADRVAIFTTTVFKDYDKYRGSVLLIGIIFRSIQLYCDFSGYMDIAEGISEIFGIHLPKNFDHPFFSQTAGEFWRRWHISLGQWFKDYVYLPLVTLPLISTAAYRVRVKFGKRAGKALMSIIPLMVVWILTGLWHGTSVNYLIWGIYWGIIISFSTVFSKELAFLTVLFHIDTSKWGWKLFRQVRTFFLFTLARFIVLKDALHVLNRMKEGMYWGQLFDGTLYTIGLNRPEFLIALLAICIVWRISVLQDSISIRQKISECNFIFRWVIYYIAIFIIIIFGEYGLGYNSADFIYMQF